MEESYLRPLGGDAPSTYLRDRPDSGSASFFTSVSLSVAVTTTGSDGPGQPEEAATLEGAGQGATGCLESGGRAARRGSLREGCLSNHRVSGEVEGPAGARLSTPERVMGVKVSPENVQSAWLLPME